MRKLKEIFEHTVDVGMLTPESIVYDLGSRSYGFAKGVKQFVGQVYCVDPDRDVLPPPEDEAIYLIHAAVCPPSMRDIAGVLVKWGNGTGNYILQRGMEPNKNSVLQYCDMLTLDELTVTRTMPDVIKFDIEGMEIPVLSELAAPPAKQLTIEFHMHTGTTFETVQKVVKHLEGLGYETVQHEMTKRHGLPVNFWDSLFVLR